MPRGRKPDGEHALSNAERQALAWCMDQYMQLQWFRKRQKRIRG